MRELTVRAELEVDGALDGLTVGEFGAALSSALHEVARVKHLEVLEVTPCGLPYPECICPDEETYEEDNRA